MTDELRRASELRDHDLTIIDGETVMVTWTIGLGREYIRVGFVPEAGGPERFRDLQKSERRPYRGRA